MNEYKSGMGTSIGMWKFLSEMLDGEPLPESLNAALYSLRRGDAMVVPKLPTSKMIQNAVVGDPLGCDVPEGDEEMIYKAIWDFMLSASDIPEEIKGENDE